MQTIANLQNLSKQDLLKQIEMLQAEAKQRLTCKVSQKGAVSLYGLGRFPVTLYGSQWQRLLENSNEIQAFIAANASQLAHK